MTKPLIANPYVGPRTFSRNEKNQFFGRDREARDLRSLVVSERLVLFYAQSGAGKSSLINTRLIPQLVEDEGFVALPIGRVGGELPDGIDDVNNIFAFNLMLNLEKSGGDPGRFTHMSLPDFLAGLTTSDGEHYVYDETVSLTGASDHNDDEFVEPPHVLIIDQFEEIVTSHLERWPERTEFFRQLNQAMADDPLLWVVLTLREDNVAALRPYARMLPGQMRARFYMQRMKSGAALLAIKEPAQLGNRPFADGVAEALLNNLRQIRATDEEAIHFGEFVEPVQLQVVCYQLWQNLKGRDAAPITEQDLAELGDVDKALAQFYEQALTHTLQKTNVSELELRNWFGRKLITEAETRGTVYQGQTSTAGLDNRVVQSLADQFLLRTETRAGGHWVELVHDRFIGPILQANQAWNTRQSPLTQAALAWHRTSRSRDLLYQDAQLKDALAQTDLETAELLVQEFLTASEEAQSQRDLEAKEKSAKRFRGLAIALFVVSMMAAAFGLFALNQRNTATSASATSVVNAEIAGTSASNAKIAENEARVAAEQAIVEKALADDAKGTAEAESTRAFEQQTLADNANATAQAASNVAITAQAEAEAARDDAENQRRLVLAQSLAFQGLDRDTGNNDSELRTLLALEANRINQEANGNLQSIIDKSLRLALSEPFYNITLTKHEEAFLSVAFSPDGQWLASGNRDHTIHLWNLTNLAPPMILEGHDSIVSSVAFSPDGQTLASGSFETILLWNLTDPNATPTILEGHEGFVQSVAFSPNGQTLASGSWDETIRLWNLSESDSTTPPVVLEYDAFVHSVAFSPDGQTLASGSDEIIRLWNLSDLTIDPVSLKGHENDVYSVAFSPDGQTLASGGFDNSIRLWNLSDLTADPVILEGYRRRIRSVAFSRNGQWLASGNTDKTVQLWNLRSSDFSSNPPIVLEGHDDIVNSVAFSPNGQMLASASGTSDDGSDNSIRLWNLVDSVADSVFLGLHEDTVNSVAFSPDGLTLASGSGQFMGMDDNSVRLWNLNDPTADPVVLIGHESPVNSVAFSPNGQILASASGRPEEGSDNSIRLWNLNDLTIDPILLIGHNDTVNSVAFSPDGKTLASGSTDNSIRLWNLTDHTADPVVLIGHESDVNSVAFSSDGKTLASGSFDNSIRLWNLIDPNTDLVVLHSNNGGVKSVAFSPDGHWLASGNADSIVRLWSLTDTNSPPIILGNYNSGSVSISHDGQWVAAGSFDDTIHLWNLSNPFAAPAVLEGYNVHSLAFSPDGRTLAFSLGNIIRLWPRLSKLVEIGCQTVKHNLSWAEWQRYLGPDEPYNQTCPNLPIPADVPASQR